MVGSTTSSGRAHNPRKACSWRGYRYISTETVSLTGMGWLTARIHYVEPEVIKQMGGAFICLTDKGAGMVGTGVGKMDCNCIFVLRKI